MLKLSAVVNKVAQNNGVTDVYVTLKSEITAGCGCAVPEGTDLKLTAKHGVKVSAEGLTARFLMSCQCEIHECAAEGEPGYDELDPAILDPNCCDSCDGGAGNTPEP